MKDGSQEETRPNALPQPKFDIGDTAYYAYGWYGGFDIPCPDCLGTKEWKAITPAGDTFNITCSTCMFGYFPTGSIKQYGPRFEARLLTVGSIKIETCDKEHPISYMCLETGVGTGSVYHECDLYASEDEAKEAAERKAINATEAIRKREDERLAKERKKGRSKPSWEKREINRLEKEVARLRRELEERERSA